MLVIVVAVFLAYNANSGLPFVPTTQLKVDLANGANLVPGNEVRSGGFRIGVVSEMQPVALPGGKVGAQLTLKLDRSSAPSRSTRTSTIRPRSALGLKYVELDRGVSRRTLADGATLPAAPDADPGRARPGARDVRRADAPRGGRQPRRASATPSPAAAPTSTRRSGSCPSSEDHLTSVMANLADPSTEHPGFFKELGDAARVVAPVSKTNAHLFTTMADTFDAISRDPQALQDTISKAPATLDAGTRSLRVQRPFLEHTAALSTDLDAAAVELRRALPDVNARARSRRRPCSAAMTSSTTTCRARSTRSTGLVDGADDERRRCAACTATIGTRAAAARASSARTSRSATTGTTSGPRGRAPLGARRHRQLAARAAQHGLGAPGHRRDRRVRGQRVRPRPGPAARRRPPGPPRQRSTAPAVDAQGQRELRRRPDRLHRGRQPATATRRVQGDPYRARPSTEPPSNGPLGPTYTQFDRNGKGVGLGPTHVPAGETFTDAPGGHGVDVPKGGSREAPAPQGHGRTSAFGVGVLTLAIAAVVTYFGFTKEIPFRHHYTVAGRLPVGERHPHELAGADRGRATSARSRRSATSRTARRPRS